MDLAPGTEIDRYVVQAPIGSGSTSVVYCVKHTRLGSLHGLKVLRVPSTAVRERLVQEGTLQASLRHPNIIPVTDVIDVDGWPGLIMDYVDGPSLDTFLSSKDLTLDQAQDLGNGILQGVVFAHQRGFIHRDLKPGNILLAVLESVLVPRITDFGLAKLLSSDRNESASISGVALGTPPYMAPEQIRSAKHVDERADVFSLGAILYELVCGQRAFQGASRVDVFKAIQEANYAPVRSVVPDAPDRMVLAVEGALRVRTERRIQSAAALLATWQGSGVYTPSQAPAPPRVVGAWDSDTIGHARELAPPSVPPPSHADIPSTLPVAVPCVAPDSSAPFSARKRLFAIGALAVVVLVAIAVWWLGKYD